MAYDLGVSEGLNKLSNTIGRGSAVSNLLRKGSRALTKVSKDAFAIPVANAGTPDKFVYGPAPQQNFTPYTAPAVSVPKVNTSVNTGSTDSRGGNNISGYQVKGDETQSELQNLRDMQLGQISEQFGEESKRLGNVEKRARAAAGEAIANAEAYYPQFQQLVGEQAASTEGQIGNLENQRKYESERALGQARQLLNDLQRRQYAQMSATGNYGSSVPEAFADQFGNKAYAAQSQIQQSRDQSLNELGQKRVEAKQYFDQKLFEGKQKYDTLIAGLKQQLNAQLNQIEEARGSSSAAKRAGTLEAWNNYVNNKFSLDQELRSYQNQLANYAAETESLADMSTAPQATAAEIQNSNSNDILGGLNAGIQNGGLTVNSWGSNPGPIYSRRKVVDPLDPNNFTEGLQFNPTR